MTREQKIEWLRNATDKELLRQLVSFEMGNKYGCYDEDIDLTENEILRRMAK